MNPMNADTPLWQQPEGKQLEFKRDLSSPQNVLKTLPEPRVVEITTGVRLSVFLDTPHDAGSTAAQNPSLAHTNAQVSEQVSEQVAKLLLHCAAQPRSKQELLGMLGLSNAYLNYKRHIVPLLEQGLIAMTLPDKPQSRLQRYRISTLGQTLLAQATASSAPNEKSVP